MIWNYLPPLLKPDILIRGTVLKLSVRVLKDRGIKGLILDVDDTLVSKSQRIPDPDISSWLVTMQQEFPIWLVSNNPNQRRIAAIAQEIQLPYIHRARKPSRRSLRRATTEMRLQPAEVGIIGDRVLTDVLGGNRLGGVTVLVDPVHPGFYQGFWGIRF